MRLLTISNVTYEETSKFMYCAFAGGGLAYAADKRDKNIVDFMVAVPVQFPMSVEDKRRSHKTPRRK